MELPDGINLLAALRSAAWFCGSLLCDGTTSRLRWGVAGRGGALLRRLKEVFITSRRLPAVNVRIVAAGRERGDSHC